jgi:hypothetical protein
LGKQAKVLTDKQVRTALAAVEGRRYPCTPAQSHQRRDRTWQCLDAGAHVRGFRNHHEIAGHRDGEWAACDATQLHSLFNSCTAPVTSLV